MSKIDLKIVGPAAPEGQEVEDQKLYQKVHDLRGEVVKMVQKARELAETPREAPSLPPGDDEVGNGFSSGVSTIEPPYDLHVLNRLFENSSSLRPNIEAMQTNIDGFGHCFVPTIDFSAPDILSQIRDILVAKEVDDKNIEDLMALDLEELEALDPTPEELEKTKQKWQRISQIEKSRIESFFKYLNPLETFRELRKRTRLDIELLGNSIWEIIRSDPEDPNSLIEQVHQVPFVNFMIIRTDMIPVTTKVMVKKDPVHYEELEVERYFFGYVRQSSTRSVYYKEFGDPRFMSMDTGRYYESLEEFRKSEPEARLAHEVFHWKVDSPVSVYGIPRWIGNLPAVLGSRSVDEVNLAYFESKAIPPMAILVSGGRLSEQSHVALKTHIEENIRGKGNFHKILILEGLPAEADVSEGDLEASGKARISFHPLNDATNQDSLFQNYDSMNTNKIGRSFRQPPMVTGDPRDVNRSTAMVTKALVEEQVYQPERERFDSMVNRQIMPNLRAHFWEFKTNAPVQRLPAELVTNLAKASEAGIITPNEARPILGDAFNTQFSYREEDWAKVPTKLALAAARQGAMAGVEPVDMEDMAEEEFADPGDSDEIADDQEGETNLENFLSSFVDQEGDTDGGKATPDTSD